jgi:hypothetical protein
MNEHRGQRIVHHAGGVVGGSSQMIKFVDHELDIIVMTNGRSAVDLYSLVDAIADRCLPGLPAAPRDFGGDLVLGTFYSQRTGRVLNFVGHEGRQALTMGGMTLPALRAADGSMSVPILPTDLIIRPMTRSDSPVRAVTITEFGHEDRLDRVEPPAHAGAADIVGEYSSGRAGLTASIYVQEDGARMRLKCASGAVDYQLTCIGPALWQASSTLPMPLGSTLEMNGAGFQWTTGRTTRLSFERVK